MSKQRLIDAERLKRHYSWWAGPVELTREELDTIVDMQPDAAPAWIPVSERLPEAPYGCLVTIWDTDFITMDEFENILPYFVGWDGEQWNDADGEQCPFEVIAWMPLPEPYGEVRRDD